MEKIKIRLNQIVGIIFAIINILWVIYFAYLFYCYRFTNVLWNFIYPDRVLFVNMLFGIIGFYLSVLLFKNKLKMKFFLIIEIILFYFGFLITS